MKKILSVVFALSILLTVSFSTQAQRKTDLNKKQPHYFLQDLETTTDPPEQWERYFRYLNAASNCIGSATGVSIFFNSLTETRMIAGKKVKFIFEPYKRASDGRILFYNNCEQVYITEEQYQVAVEDFVRQAELAMESNYNFYEPLEKLAVEVQMKSVKEKLNMSEDEFRKLLSSPVAEETSITHRQLYYLPYGMKKTDFVPSEVHISYLPESILGMAWLHSGVVYTSLASRMTDYLRGKPLVMQHEFVHGNPMLQNIIISSAFDLELEASIPMVLLSEDKLGLPFHGYTRDLREMIHVFFGLDTEQAKKEIILFNHGGSLRIDPDKFREYSAKMDLVKAELLKWFPGALAEFYSNQVFWTGLADKLGDNKIVFRVKMAMDYDPTILDGHEKTMAFLKPREDEIRQIFDEEYRDLDKNSSNDEEAVDMQKYASLFAQAERLTGIDREELIRLGKKYNIKPESLKNKSLGELFSLLAEIRKKEMREVKQ